MIQIKSFKATDYEFKELARIDNLVNHDSISDPDEDKNDWKIRDKSENTRKKSLTCLEYRWNV